MNSRQRLLIALTHQEPDRIPLASGVRGTPEEVYAAAMDCLQKAASGGGMILSFGGGVSPGTRPENIDALLQAVKDY